MQQTLLRLPETRVIGNSGWRDLELVLEVSYETIGLGLEPQGRKSNHSVSVFSFFLLLFL